MTVEDLYFRRGGNKKGSPFTGKETSLKSFPVGGPQDHMISPTQYFYGNNGVSRGPINVFASHGFL